eukprot:3842130-Prymnesium_polylepis.1
MLTGHSLPPLFRFSSSVWFCGLFAQAFAAATALCTSPLLSEPWDVERPAGWMAACDTCRMTRYSESVCGVPRATPFVDAVWPLRTVVVALRGVSVATLLGVSAGVTPVALDVALSSCCMNTSYLAYASAAAAESTLSVGVSPYVEPARECSPPRHSQSAFKGPAIPRPWRGVMCSIHAVGTCSARSSSDRARGASGFTARLRGVSSGVRDEAGERERGVSGPTHGFC